MRCQNASCRLPATYGCAYCGSYMCDEHIRVIWLHADEEHDARSASLCTHCAEAWSQEPSPTWHITRLPIDAQEEAQ